MRWRLTITFAAVAAALTLGCSPDSFQTFNKRRKAQLPSPSPETEVGAQETTLVQIPKLVIEENIVNCQNNDKCHLEEINEPYNDTEDTTHRINSLIVVESELLTSPDINEAPAIRFSIVNLDQNLIKDVTYSYKKRDTMGNVLSETTSFTLHTQVPEDKFYEIPIHASTMGGGILVSAPYEKHIITVKIINQDNIIYPNEIEFFIISHTVNPIIFDRNPEIYNSSYYTMNNYEEDFTIDSVSIENSLPFSITFTGSINITNTTLAALSDTRRNQQVSFVPKQGTYPWDIYHWFTNTETTYKSAIATPIYSLILYRGENTVEEIPITIDTNNGENIIYFEELELVANETVRINLIAHVNVNNSLLGDHGQETFYEGDSLCDNLNSPIRCLCFYHIKDANISNQFNANMYYMPMLAYSDTLNETYYPNCSGSYNQLITKNLDAVNYPEKILALVGRHHVTDTKYTFTSWLKDYEDYDDLGTITKTMDTLESLKGDVDYSVLDTSLNYEGYIPGTI